MANFCTRCGRPLQEGEVCNCQGQATLQNDNANENLAETENVQNATVNNASDVNANNEVNDMASNNAEVNMQNNMQNVGYDYQQNNMQNNMQNAGYDYQQNNMQNNMQNAGYDYQQNNMQNNMQNAGYGYQQNNMQYNMPNQGYYNGNQYGYQKQNVFFKELFGTLKGFFTNTEESNKAYVATGDFKISFVFIVLQAIATATLACVSVGKIYSYLVSMIYSFYMKAFSGFTCSLSSSYSSKYMSSGLDINYALIFFVALIFSAIASFIFAAVALGAHAIMGKKTSYTQELKLVSTRSIALTVGRLLVVLCLFINIQFAVAIYSLTTMWGIIVIITADDCTQCPRGKQKVLIWLAVFAVMFIVEYLTLRIGTNIIGDSLTRSLSGFSTSKSSFGL